MKRNERNAIQNRPSHISSGLLALLLAGVASAATEVASPLAWDCWIGEHEPVSISCVQQPALFDFAILADPDERSEAMLLAVIHERVMSRRTTGLDEFVKAHLGDLGEDTLHTIPIWDYPDELSWMEGRPAELVRAILCPREIPCSVTLNRMAP